MPLKKGNTNIDAIYKGTTQIAKIYKGTTLLFENAKWLDYLFNYLYHNLIPTTIDNKTVQDKARLTKISGNGVVENQLVQNGNFADNSIWFTEGGVTLSISNGIATVTNTVANNGIAQYLNFISGHKYLVIAEVKTDESLTVRVGSSSGASVQLATTPTSVFSKYSGIFTCSSDATIFYIFCNNTGTYQVKNVMLIDLTLMFGTGNEPTTLTDNRIQALLNRGYIAYNIGSYKNSRVSEIECEPYNLFDEILEGGGINSQGVDIANADNFRSKDYIEVVGGKTYTFEYVLDAILPATMYLIEFDKSKVKIKDTSVYYQATHNFTLTNETCYVRFQFYRSGTNWLTNPPLQTDLKCCFHITGTRTDYAPYQAPTKITLNCLLELNGAINSHDTFEITNTDYVFTRNIGVVDLGTLNWSILNAGNFYCTRNLEWKKPTNDNIIGNIVCYLYTQDTATNIQSSSNYKDKTIGLNVDPQIIVRDSAYTTAADFKTAMAGIYAYLELATPQVITIPKKHLGCVDLGSLSWAKLTSSNGVNYFYSQVTGIKSGVLGNSSIYCGKYKTLATINVSVSSTSNFEDLSICQSIGGTSINIRDDSSYANMTNTQFKSAMAGVYLFYETEDEVDDINELVDIEAGGSITSDSEVLPNVEMSIKCK